MLTLFSNKSNKNVVFGGVLGTLLLTGIILPAYAAVPIEQRALSTSGNAAVNANSIENSQGSTLWQLYQQVQQLQQEVRELRGQLEDQQDGIERTQKDLKNRYADLDQRIELINQAQSQEDNPDAADPADGTGNSATGTTPSNSPATDTARKEVALNPTKLSNNTSPNTGTAPSPATSTANTAQMSQSTAENEKQAYVSAYEAYKNGGAAKAIIPMQQFISDYPNSVFVPNAHYWLGEFYLASDPVDFVKAKQSFIIVVNKYPKSAKASTSLYRLATITKEIDHRPQEAITLMKKLIQDYPASQEAGFAKSFLNTN